MRGNTIELDQVGEKKMNIDLKEVVKDLREVDPNMSREELFDHCMRIGTHNGMPTQQIINEVTEILSK